MSRMLAKSRSWVDGFIDFSCSELQDSVPAGMKKKTMKNKDKQTRLDLSSAG